MVLKFASLTSFNTDEFWAWDIAADLNFREIIELMHYEGHSFLWYLILKPFVHLSNIFPEIFPSVIKFVSLFFLFIVMFLLWFFAPFNNLLKLLISMSSPFLILYPSIGRPYSLTIGLIFLLTILFKNKAQHPFLYSIILFLCANATLNGLLAAIVFGGFFFYDLYKENRDKLFSKQVVVPAIIFCSIFLVLAIEWIPVYFPSYIYLYGTVSYVIEFLFDENYPNKFWGLLTVFLYGPLVQIVVYLHAVKLKDKSLLLFMFLIMNALAAFYLVIAPARFHHLYFFYIFFIVIYWLLIDVYPEYKENKLPYYSYLILLISMSIFYSPLFKQPDFWFFDEQDYKQDAGEILETIPKNSTIFMPMDYSSGLVPFIKKYYNLKTPQGLKIPSLEAYQGIYQAVALPIDQLPIDKTQDNYYILPFKYLEDFEIMQNLEGIRENPFCHFTKRKVYLVCKIEKE